MASDDAKREAARYVAERLAKHAEPLIARSLTDGKSDRLDSETAHRLAAKIAREHDRQRGE